MTGEEWISEFARLLGVPAPDEATFQALLALAGTAAHGSERIAAPIACYLVGVAGADIASAHALAVSVAASVDEATGVTEP